jgi:hypothetical protein
VGADVTTAGGAVREVAATGEPGSKGLKGGALRFVSSVVIGVASTAPGCSLAASLGLVAVVVGDQAPAIMWMAFVPMFFIAAAYYYMNRADPDCGTTFSWVTKALGPYLGWMGGWAILIADIIVMANLAEIASLYTFDLVGIDEPDPTLVLALGVGWIALTRPGDGHPAPGHGRAGRGHPAPARGRRARLRGDHPRPCRRGAAAAAAAYDAASIVVGHHREGPIRGAILGSTAYALVHKSDRPLLLVPPGGHG